MLLSLTEIYGIDDTGIAREGGGKTTNACRAQKYPREHGDRTQQGWLLCLDCLFFLFDLSKVLSCFGRREIAISLPQDNMDRSHRMAY